MSELLEQDKKVAFLPAAFSALGWFVLSV